MYQVEVNGVGAFIKLQHGPGMIRGILLGIPTIAWKQTAFSGFEATLTVAAVQVFKTNPGNMLESLVRYTRTEAVSWNPCVPLCELACGGGGNRSLCIWANNSEVGMNRDEWGRE